MVKRASWLSVTPEPERELPEAAATLAAGRPADDVHVERERARVQQLVMHGTQRRWLAYLHEIVELIEARGPLADTDADVAHARQRAAAVIANHHNLLLALPGRGAAVTAADRVALEQLPKSERGAG